MDTQEGVPHVPNMSKLNEMLDESYQDHLQFLELAREQTPDGVYREGTPEYENLTEAYIALGMALGMRFAATIPMLSEVDDSGDHS
jgi:hypothetical protein